jgi:uncharacterized protein (PEP-CTERM system associated)
LIYTIDPQIKLSITGGQESNNYLTTTQQTSSITGIGFNWAPTERTRVDLSKERRYFGDGHSFNLSHRMARASFRLSDKKDVMVLSPQLTTFSKGTYFQLWDDQLRSLYPELDDAQRANLALALLQMNGIPPDAAVIGTSQAPRASLMRSQEASMLLTGVRNTVTLSVQRSERTALSQQLVGVPDDFSLSSVIRQRGANFNWSYRVSSLSTLSFLATTTRSEGVSGSNLNTKLNSSTVSLTRKLGAFTNGTLSYRRTRSDGLFDYVENAITANVLLTF